MMETSFKLINLDVGGKKFITYYDTLKRSTYFEELVQNKKGLQAVVIGKDEDQSFFIDRDGQVFEEIMHYLRSCDIRKKSQAQLKRLKNEAAFFKFDELIVEVDQALCGYEEDQVHYYLEPADIDAATIQSDSQKLTTAKRSTVVRKLKHTSVYGGFESYAIYETSKKK